MASSKALGPVPCVRVDGPLLEVTVLPVASGDRTLRHTFIVLNTWEWSDPVTDSHPHEIGSIPDDDVRPDAVVG